LHEQRKHAIAMLGVWLEEGTRFRGSLGSFHERQRTRVFFLGTGGNNHRRGSSRWIDNLARRGTAGHCGGRFCLSESVYFMNFCLNFLYFPIRKLVCQKTVVGGARADFRGNGSNPRCYGWGRQDAATAWVGETDFAIHGGRGAGYFYRGRGFISPPRGEGVSDWSRAELGV